MSPPAGLPRRALPALTLLAGLVLAVLLVLVVLSPSDRADALAPTTDPAAPSDVEPQVVLVMTGVSWEDVTDQATPTLDCLADHGRLGALSQKSDTGVTTTTQGLESLHTGYRGSDPADPSPEKHPDVLAGTDVDIVDLGAVSPVGTVSDSERARQLRAVDDALATELDRMDGGEHGSGAACSDPPGFVLASIATVAQAQDADGIRAQLGVLIDTTAATAASGQASGELTSGSTRQSGIVQIVDLAPTLLVRAGQDVPPDLPGSDLTAAGGTAEDARRAVLDRTLASRLVENAIVPVAIIWAVLLVGGLVCAGTARMRARPRARAAAAWLLTGAAVLPAAALQANRAPWWRAEHPILTLMAVVVLVIALFTAISRCGPWRRRRGGATACAGAIVALVFLVESAAGSPLQTSALFGSQPTIAGRFYGVSNPQFGMTLAALMVVLVPVLERLQRPWSRVLVVAATGGTMIAVFASPALGADFGTILAALPAFGLLALLVSGTHARAWHIIALGLCAAVAVTSVSVLDWMRPPEQRSHLGRFIQTVLDGGGWDVIVRKLDQNLGTLLHPPLLLIGPVILVLVTIACTAPGRVGTGRIALVRDLAADQRAHPVVRQVMIALFTGIWIGFLTNDTGSVLAGSALVVAIGLGVVSLLDEPHADTVLDEPQADTVRGA